MSVYLHFHKMSLHECKLIFLLIFYRSFDTNQDKNEQFIIWTCWDNCDVIKRLQSGDQELLDTLMSQRKEAKKNKKSCLNTYCKALSDKEGASKSLESTNAMNLLSSTLVQSPDENQSIDQDMPNSISELQRRDILKQNTANNKRPVGKNNMINLENILKLESKLTKIVQDLADPSDLEDIIMLWEEWWDLSREETMLQNLGNVFKEPKYKIILKTATCLETFAITIWHSTLLQSEGKYPKILTGKFVQYNKNNNLHFRCEINHGQDISKLLKFHKPDTKQAAFWKQG